MVGTTLWVDPSIPLAVLNRVVDRYGQVDICPDSLVVRAVDREAADLIIMTLDILGFRAGYTSA